MSEYVSLLEQAERLTLTNGSKQLAEIRLADDAGRWMFAVSCQQHAGDFWGFGEPLGYEPGRARRDFGTRDEALAAAIEHLRQRISRRPQEMAPQLAWLDTLIPDQPDLFGVAA